MNDGANEEGIFGGLLWSDGDITGDKKWYICKESKERGWEHICTKEGERGGGGSWCRYAGRSWLLLGICTAEADVCAGTCWNM